MGDFSWQDDMAESDELLKRALVDVDAAVTVALRVDHLPLSDVVTVVFHARRDLGMIQTYIARGSYGPGEGVPPRELMRVPCDLDLARASSRDEAERIYAEQAASLREALIGADTVLSIWHEPLTEIESDVEIEIGSELRLTPPAPRLLPTALVAVNSGLVVLPVCGPRTLSEGKPPLGIACIQHDVSRVYPLPDDPERCLADFADAVAERAHRLEDELERQEASLDRFLELNGDDDLPQAG